MPKLKQVLVGKTKTKTERASARKALGRLSGRIVLPSTAARYAAACAWFFRLASQEGYGIGSSLLEFDHIVSKAIDVAWQEGEARNLIGDLLSGLQHFVPSCKHALRSS